MAEHQPKILGVIGSLRAQSHTARMVELVLEAAVRAGAQTRLWDLRRSPLPLFNPDAEREAPAYLKGREDILWADALVLGSPDYHGSMSGPMKNLLDFYWKEFTGKLFGYVCSSHEKGLTCMDQMRTAVRQCYGWSLPYGIGFNGDADLASGRPSNERLRARLEGYGHDLARYGALLHGQFLCDRAAQPRLPGFASVEASAGGFDPAPRRGTGPRLTAEG